MNGTGATGIITCPESSGVRPGERVEIHLLSRETEGDACGKGFCLREPAPAVCAFWAGWHLGSQATGTRILALQKNKKLALSVPGEGPFLLLLWIEKIIS